MIGAVIIAVILVVLVVALAIACAQDSAAQDRAHQLDRMHAETGKPLRALTLEALRAIGITVTDEDIAGKRGRKKS